MNPEGWWLVNIFTFGYDNLDRLTGVTYFDTLVDAFAMDDLGNHFFRRDLHDEQDFYKERL